MDEDFNSDKTLLEMERAELNLLVQRGFHFEVSVGKRKKKFVIEQTRLDTLDLISDISLDMVMSEE